MKSLWGTWNKIGGAPDVEVLIHGFSQATADGKTRPVAIVEVVSTGELRYVDLQYIKITEAVNDR